MEQSHKFGFPPFFESHGLHNRALISCFKPIFFTKSLLRVGSDIQTLHCQYLDIYYSIHKIVMTTIMQLKALTTFTYEYNREQHININKKANINANLRTEVPVC